MVEITLEQLRHRTMTALDVAIDSEYPVALLDFPMHTNVGDHMIYAGERAYLRQMHIAVTHVSHAGGFEPRALRRRMPRGTILINGGGNFGDIWPHIQAFRELVAQECRDYPIVQLPQSIFYRDEANARRANRILGRHPDFTLMVRDTPSLRRAERLLPDVRTAFVPDMALGWTPARVTPSGRNPKRVLTLARTDQEATSGLGSIVKDAMAADDDITDWTFTAPEKFGYLMSKVPARIARERKDLANRGWFCQLLEASYGGINRANLRAGTKMFSTTDIVVTDRLHAHILATLMGIPNIAIDNEYGKVSAIYDDYSGHLGDSSFVSTSEELNEKLRLLRAGPINPKARGEPHVAYTQATAASDHEETQCD